MERNSDGMWTRVYQRTPLKRIGKCRPWDERKAFQKGWSFFERINALEQKIALYSNDLGHIKDTVDEMNDNLKSLMEKPGKLQDKIIAYVITGIIGIVLGFALKGIFPV